MYQLGLLMEASDAIKMKLHPSKSKFLTVNTKEITYCDQYIYLGSPISNDTIQRQVENHSTSKACHVWKFESFLSKNSEAL